MAIEDVGGAIVITGNDIDRFRLLSLRGRLQLEMKGFKFRISTFGFVKRHYRLKGNRKTVYRKFCEMHNLPLGDDHGPSQRSGVRDQGTEER